MAAIDELEAALGQPEAERLYRLVIAEYNAHLRRHVNAAKASAPTQRMREAADTVLTALTGLDADPNIRTVRGLHTLIETGTLPTR